MRTIFNHTFAAPRPEAAGAWFPGLPHVLAALAAWPVFGSSACAAGLVMAGFISFVVWLPMMALALNQGQPLAVDDAAPILTPNAKRVLFALWVATAWLAAAISK